MRTNNLLKATPLLFAASSLAQTFNTYTDPASKITFYEATLSSTDTNGGFQWGIALPKDESGDNTEYLGHLVGSIQNGAGWSGVSHGSGMPNALLLVAWADGNTVRTSFRYAGGYVTPDIYSGNAVLTPISSSVNSTHFSLIYRCQNCWSWNHNGATGNQLPVASARSVLVLGWAQASKSPNPVSSSNGAVAQHDNGQGQWGAPIASMRQASYSSWLPGSSATATPTVSPTASASATPTACVGTPAPTAVYDYIVAGAGAGGIPIADKLSEAGYSVLLIEKGPPSSGRWGGTMKPAWLDGTNLTRFDVPGLCNEIWVDSAGIACTGIDQMAGCVLGGGVAVNAALWWKPPAVDWDYNFPTGWKSADMRRATQRVFQRIPGTDHPSADGIRYRDEGYQVISGALKAAGWKNLTSGANNAPDEKHRTFAHTPYMYSHGERGGPMATYLVTAAARKNFKLLMNTSVRRIVRTGGHATGVELEGGACGVVKLTPRTGRVILSAGVFGSSKILFRSGIGPEDQLNTVKGSSDGPTMIGSADWIKLPVGKNLNDHVSTDVVVRHPSVVFYDFYEAFNTPNPDDKAKYLNNRTGILTQSAPNIGPMFWEVIPGSQNGDGIDRQLQWTARVEPSLGETDLTSMTLSQYLGRGSNSRGALGITGALTIQVTDAPYLKTDGDKKAVVQGLTNLLAALAKNPDIVVEQPAPGLTPQQYIDAYVVSAAARRANHWMGSTKMGTDNGLIKNGTSVVDTNTRVYGTDNIFVVDAGVFPGEPATNPSAPIVVVAERAAERILALEAPRPGRKNAQCGGVSWTGSRYCEDGLKCVWQTDNLSRCQ